MNDKVSVIIPTYKRSDLLERAIKSVINQTYKNIEIIVVDDNVNNSKEHLQNLKIIEKYPQIIYIKNKKNLGGGLTRNVGIKASTGEYIAFLDDDDEFYPTKIEKQYQLYKSLDNSNVGMIYCYVENVNENGDTINIYKRDYEGIALYNHMINFITTTSAYFIRKDVLLDIGMFDDVSSQQDARLLLKMLGRGYEIYRIPEVLIKLYIHDGERITKVSDKYISAVNDYYNECKKYYNQLTKHQHDKVDYKFHNQLCNLYINNNNRKKAFSELIKMIKIDVFDLRTLYDLYKIIFKKTK